MKLLFPLLVALTLASNSFSAIVNLHATFNISSHTATLVYPSLQIDTDDEAEFFVTYDSASAPSDTAEGYAGYNLLGSAVLIIGDYMWASDSFSVNITNNPSSLATPVDIFSFRSSMVSEAPFSEPLHDVSFDLASENISFISGLELPDSTDDLDIGVVLYNRDFSVSPPTGTTPSWNIGGSEIIQLHINTVPEPSSAFLLFCASGGLLRRRRA